MKDGHGGVTVGSEISGGARNIFAEDCRMDSPHLERALRLKTNSVRGGVIEHIFIRNVTIGQVSEPSSPWISPTKKAMRGEHPPTVRHIEIEKVISRKSKYVLYLKGYARAPISDIRLINCAFENTAQPNLVEHVAKLVLKDVQINGVPVSD